MEILGEIMELPKFSPRSIPIEKARAIEVESIGRAFCCFKLTVFDIQKFALI
jgi:hypothetical protein